MSKFFRFPHTPHLVWLGEGSPRDDKVMQRSEADWMLSGEVIVEEKLDGANLGFSLDHDGNLRVQNRGSYLEYPYRGQFSRLGSWIAMRRDQLESVLTTDLILFGEWCAARHSVSYQNLPDWFLGFDVYEHSTCRFWSTQRRNQMYSEIGIAGVPLRFRGETCLDDLKNLLTNAQGSFNFGPMEGVIVRREQGERLVARAKLVRADFVQGITEHWATRAIEWNHLAPPGD